MDIANAIIHITNLRLRTYIGFNPEEQVNKQDVVINIEIHYPGQSACQTDAVDEALNYKTVCKQVISHVEGNRFQLLEKLTADVLSIAADHPSVTRALVTVDKPHALRFADSVSLTLEWRR
ncbi:MAG: dihydroneopterin triphosphate 2'-epimerase [Ketobacteraceae bacterium]|nr:dihydroneopterin triphosphate 2'-epimerase [Ketobacteraceae bacterium]